MTRRSEERPRTDSRPEAPRDASAGQAPASPRPAPWWRAAATADTWRRALYALLSLPVGVLGFVLVVLGLGVGLYTLLVVFGVFILMGTVAAARRMATWERGRARSLLGLETLPPHRRQPPKPGLVSRFGTQLRDRQTWREIGYLLLSLPVGVVSSMLVMLAGGLLYRAATYPILALADESIYRNAWGGPTYLGAVLVHSGQGLLVLLLAPAVIRAVTSVQARLVQALLAGDPGQCTDGGNPGGGRRLG